MQELKNLEPNPDAFLIGIVSRLVHQNGLDYLLDISDQLFQNKNIQLIVLGTGEDKLERDLTELASRFPGQIHVVVSYDINLAHLIFAGFDAFLIPSRYEPCGLTQVYSMKYGTVPIAHWVGGLADTVFDDPLARTGFTFKYFTNNGLKNAIERAYNEFSLKPEKWKQTMIRLMKLDLSWKNRALKWNELYNSLLEEKINV